VKEPGAQALLRSDWRGAVVPIGIVLLAELFVRFGGSTGDMVAAPSAILVAIVVAIADGSLASATLETLGAAMGGLAIGGGIGLWFGIFLGLSRLFDDLMTVTIELLRPIPSTALIPVALLFFGFGFSMEASIVAFSTVWPVLILSRSAVSNIEPRLFEVSRVLGLTNAQRIRKIVLPAALPRIFVAFRLAAGIAVIVAVTVEITANPSGLGYRLIQAQQMLQTDRMYAFLVWVGLLGWTINAVLLWAQRRLFGPAAATGTK
jgi:ABC-type nitrate/sulfonate/bicarbonate transport system permease component